MHDPLGAEDQVSLGGGGLERVVFTLPIKWTELLCLLRTNDSHLRGSAFGLM